MGPPDIILGIFEAFKTDINPNKIDLSVGAYRDELGRPYVLKSVLKAEQNLVDRMPDKISDSDIGSEKFREVTYRLAVGDKLFSRPHVSVQVSIFLKRDNIVCCITLYVVEESFKIPELSNISNSVNHKTLIQSSSESCHAIFANLCLRFSFNLFTLHFYIEKSSL